MLTNLERDKFLTEVMDECWHDKINGISETIWMNNWSCCGLSKCYAHYPNDFSTAEGFFKLWNWAIKQDWWPLFNGSNCEINLSIIHPDRFADVIYKFLKDR